MISNSGSLLPATERSILHMWVLTSSRCSLNLELLWVLPCKLQLPC